MDVVERSSRVDLVGLTMPSLPDESASARDGTSPSIVPFPDGPWTAAAPLATASPSTVVATESPSASWLPDAVLANIAAATAVNWQSTNIAHAEVSTASTDSAAIQLSEPPVSTAVATLPQLAIRFGTAPVAEAADSATGTVANGKAETTSTDESHVVSDSTTAAPSALLAALTVSTRLVAVAEKPAAASNNVAPATNTPIAAVGFSQALTGSSTAAAVDKSTVTATTQRTTPVVSNPVAVPILPAVSTASPAGIVTQPPAFPLKDKNASATTAELFSPPVRKQISDIETSAIDGLVVPGVTPPPITASVVTNPESTTAVIAPVVTSVAIPVAIPVVTQVAIPVAIESAAVAETTTTPAASVAVTNESETTTNAAVATQTATVASLEEPVPATTAPRAANAEGIADKLVTSQLASRDAEAISRRSTDDDRSRETGWTAGAGVSDIRSARDVATGVAAAEDVVPVHNASQLVERVASTVVAAQEQDRSLSLRLSPPDYGQILVEVTTHEGVISARVETQTVAAQQAIVDSLPQLHDALVQLGASVDRIDVLTIPDRNDARREEPRSDARQESGSTADMPWNGAQQQPTDSRRDQPRRRPVPKPLSPPINNVSNSIATGSGEPSALQELNIRV